MNADPGSIRTARSALANEVTSPAKLARKALQNADQNAGHNTYLWRDEAFTREEAARAEAMPAAEGSGAFGDGRHELWGLPVSVKDCFDLAGSPTSCGTRFYRDMNGAANRDSWLVERLRAIGAVITGKTHLHSLAYGITGENPDFGDCVQPGDPTALTGGSSSGAAASILEGSAIAAIGTDTGGSVRVPAALCGLAGYRASLGRGDWRGGAHLAQSFDTMGWLFRDLEEAPLLSSVFAPSESTYIQTFTRFAIVGDDFLHDCDRDIISSYRQTIRDLESVGLESIEIDTIWWSDSRDIFAPIQAWEAAALHRGHFEHVESSIRQRLEWGAQISLNEIGDLRQRHADFRAHMNELFERHQLILLPAAPVTKLTAAADHSETRGRLLRYTTPFSLAGVPAVVIPCPSGGMQLASALNNDESLLQLAAVLAAHRKAASTRMNA